MRVVEALNASLHSLLRDAPEVHFIGEDVLDPYGGAFKVASGLSTAFPERVLTTPVSEAGIIGLGTGMALRGLRPIIEIMFGDFITLAADQIINHAAKLRWMSDDQVSVPLVIRTPMGGRRGYGPTHSQSLEKHFLGVPGLRVLALGDLGDPGGLLRTAVLEEDDPVLLIEHKLLYANPVQDPSSVDEFDVRVNGGAYPTFHLSVAGAPAPAVTLAAYGHMAALARPAVLRLAYDFEIFAELIVFTQLSPWDSRSLSGSLAQTGRLLTLEEGSRTAGWGAEVISEAVTVRPGIRASRLGALDIPVPASEPLENAVLPGEDGIVHAARELVSG